MQHPIKNRIDQAIEEKNIQELRSSLNDLQHLLVYNEHEIEQFNDYLIYLLNSDKFINLGDVIYLSSTLTELLTTTAKIQEKIIQIYRLAQEKVDLLNIEFIKKVIFNEVIKHESIPWKDCLKVLEDKTFGISSFSDEYFLLILDLIRETKFLNLDKSWTSLTFILVEWDLITDKQKEKLILELENIYGKSKNWMVDFVIVELLGEYFANESAYKVLCHLSNIDNEESRALVPHCLEHLIKDSKNNKISTNAYQLLWSMQQDSSELVRNEVM